MSAPPVNLDAELLALRAECEKLRAAAQEHLDAVTGVQALAVANTYDADAISTASLRYERADAHLRTILPEVRWVNIPYNDAPWRAEAPTETELEEAGRVGALWIGTRPYTQRLLEREQPVMSAVLCASNRYSTGHRYDDDRPATRWYYVAPDGRILAAPAGQGGVP